ncbi:hypothetical protein ABLE94_05355 [Gordonia sp. VNK1]|uniref:hypothetical protein n=1 Tax=Gordonia oleivorans TaxID=3156618 RepID=UPI0032B49BFC
MEYNEIDESNDTATDTEVNDQLEGAGQPDQAETPEPPSKREARYRLQLREAQAERDTLAERLEALQRSEVERLAADLIEKPAALWTAGVKLDTLVGDDGTIDADKVTEAVKSAREQLGLQSSQQRLRRGPVVPMEGTGTDRSRPDPWKSAFNA